ncbi:MAG TPA: lactate permease LctP family transporter [Candidatus Limnocylindrales bacterium]|nr:lactate permease LctP family transporter [Candidatus Limnocylindrales bacterium]
MWQQNYFPLGGSLALSAVAAALPIFVLLFLLAGLRKPAWLSALAGLAAAALAAVLVYGMPVGMLAASVIYGAAFGLFPIGWIVFTAILLYRVTVESGKFEILKDSIGRLTDDPRLQALLIAFAFGAFVEGAAGFGTPVAVASAMLAGLGFTPFRAAAICLLANTAPVAFGSIAIPIVTLAATTGLPVDALSGAVGRLCAPVSLFIPAYLIVVMSGWRGLKEVLPHAALCGAAFASTQFAVSNFIGPQLTDILASLAAMVVLIVSIKVSRRGAAIAQPEGMLRAWTPYALLVVFVLAWGYKPLQMRLNATNISINWPGLHNLIQRMPPVVAKPAPYAATYSFTWLSAAGTACLFAAILGAVAVGMRPREFVKVIGHTGRQLALAELTLAAVLGLAFLMNYSGATATLGLAFAATGPAFPFFSALLGWVGVFLTGSDTSANALFGNLQVITAQKLGMSPVLMAAANSAGGVMGKMISLTSIAVAAAATHMKREEESRLFRFTLKHSVFLASVVGLLAFAYSASGQTLPHVEAKTLTDHKITLPDGKPAVLVIGFTHASQKETKPWSAKLAPRYPTWSIAVLQDVPKLVRGMVTHAIRGDVPESQRERFLLVLQGEKELKTAAEFNASAPDDAYLVTIDGAGAIRARYHGALTDAAVSTVVSGLQQQ